MYFGHLQYRPSHRSRKQAGYMLIVLIFLMVGLMIAALWTAPAIATAMQRDKETEMIHRGVQYTRAIKKYYKKFGRYPANLEALEDTNHMRFLRKRYKDPFSQDGKWQLVRFGQVQFNATQRPGGGGFGAGGGAALPNVPGVTGLIQGQPQQGQTGGTGLFGQPQQPNTSGVSGNVPGLSTSGSSGIGGSQSQSTTGSTSSAFGQSTTGPGGGQPLGGGAIIGVSSMSPRESLRVINDKNHYKDWKFVYDPTLDRGGMITGPYDPKKLIGKFANQNQGIGQPIGSQQQGTSSFSNGMGSQPFSTGSGSSFGQPMGQPFGQPVQPPDQNATSPH